MESEEEMQIADADPIVRKSKIKKHYYTILAPNCCVNFGRNYLGDEYPQDYHYLFIDTNIYY